MKHRLIILFALLLCFGSSSMGQTVSGFVQDENNQPVPYVNVFVKLTDYGTVTDEKGRYYIDLEEGEFEVVFSAIGYETKTIQVVLRNDDVVKNVWMKQSSVQLDEVMVRAKRRDPAYEIIQNAVKAKDRWKRQFESSTCEVYIKAKEVVDERELKRRKKQAKMEAEAAEEGARNEDEVEVDPFAEKQKERMKLAASINLVEAQLTRHWQFPNNIKEIKTAYKKYGRDFGLFFTSTTETDFNFYKSLIDVPKLSETPLISPLNATAVISYKFKLEETTFEDGHLLYKIKMTPRKQGNATWTGTVWITDELWNIKRLDLTLKKGNLTLYDEFRIRQEFQVYENDTTFVLKSQEFDYSSKTKARSFTGNTLATYEDWQLNPEFPKRFFSNEVGVVTQEAYDRDSTYWDKIRPQPLTTEEQEYVSIQDSIYEAHNKAEYLDSVDAAYNKITFGKITYFGVGHRVRSKKKEYYLGSLLDWWEPFEVGGSRLGPYANYFKKWENGKWYYISGGADIGVRNSDVKGSIYTSHLYDPMKQGRVFGRFGHRFSAINTYDAYLNMVRRSNYIENTYARLEHRYELFNGLMSSVEVSWNDRKPLGRYQFGQIMSDLIDDNNPLDFERYQSVITTAWLSYTINQKFIREPNRKVILGSRWPTLTLLYRKGWDGPLGSDIDFDQVEFVISHDFNIRTLGKSRWRLSTGKFLNTKDLRFVDYRFHRQSDAVLWSNPMYSFQNIDTTLPALDWFIEGHYIHHFNGAIINNVPFIKKTRIKTVAGGGVLYDKRSDYFYSEVFVGLERVFKIQRQRFRIGVYGVLSESNFGPPKAQLKFSLERYNNRSGRWSF